MSENDLTAGQVSTRERWLVAALTVAALALRAWQLQRAGLSQFDEGVYAFSGLGLTDLAQPHRLFPDQQKFSPPVYFSLVALSYLVAGASDHSAILVNVILGAATVPALWWIARRWVGPSAALAAASMLALGGAHILLSRTGLTDVTFALVFLVALGAVARALERTDARSAVLAGLAVGLAWNTKYHGWFALVIAALAIAAKWRLEGIPLAALRPAIRTWGIISVVAAACYVPWTIFIQLQAGSSTGWVAYFATMLRIDWFRNIAAYARQQWLLEGAWSRASVALAIVMVAWSRQRSGVARLAPPVATLAIAGAVLGAAGTALILSIATIVRRVRSKTPLPYGLWCMIALLALWLIMAPLYQPYFRLLLPFSIATFVLAGETIAVLVQRDARSAERSVASGMVALASALTLAIVIPRSTSPWLSARSLASAAEEIDRQVPSGAPVAVIGEPSLAFYLHQRGHPSFDRATLKELDSNTTPALVVTGYYVRKAPNLRDGIRDRAPALEILGRFPVVPSDLRLIDDYGPVLAPAYRVHPDSMYDLILYRFDPARLAKVARP
ncbi:MAG: glycosyltransferase family 39 protein [Gemmatimonadaceae bacterium]